MAPGYHEPNLFEMRKQVERTNRQLADEKRQLADREKALRDDDDEVFARELHAALCISQTCGGWGDADVRRDWLSFAVSLLMPDGARRLERKQLLDLAGQFATSPFYESIRSFQRLQATVSPGAQVETPSNISDGSIRVFGQPELVAGPGQVEPEPGPAASSQEPPATPSQPASTLLTLTDDDIPF